MKNVNLKEFNVQEMKQIDGGNNKYPLGVIQNPDGSGCTPELPIRIGVLNILKGIL